MNTKLSALWGTLLLLVVFLLNGCVRPISAPVTPVSASTLPLDEAAWLEAVLVMRQVLAQQLGVVPLDISVQAVEPVTWPDACLGAAQPNELCLPAATPGYKLVYMAGGERYVYHSNLDASAARLVAAPPAEIGESYISWRQTDAGGECRTAEIGAERVAFGPCAGVQLGGIYGLPERRADLAEFVATYAPFSAETPAGDLEFRGRGSRTAVPAEQRMIAEWARLVALEAQAGRSGASWGLAFAWHLEGGSPAQCGSVTAYVTGDLYVASCAGDTPQTLLATRLGAQDLAQLYGWLDTVAPFERNLPDSDGSGASARLVFSGAGATGAGEELQQALHEFAARFWAQAVPAE
jgi:hypothetical protein